MKALSKIILTIFVLNYASIQTVSAQRARVDSASNKAFINVKGRWVEVNSATPQQLEQVENQKKIKALESERFSPILLKAFYKGKGKSIFLRFSKDSAPKIFRSNDIQKIIVNGETEIEIAVPFISPKNASNYLYRIIKNESATLVPWTKVSQFKKTEDGNFDYAFLGKISSQNSGNTRIEIQHISDYKDNDVTILDWNKPEKANPTVYLNYFPKGRHELISYPLSELMATPSLKLNIVETENLKDIKIRMGDSLSNIIFISKSKAFNYNVKMRRSINGLKEEISLENAKGPFTVHKAHWDKPGTYTIILTPELVDYSGVKYHLNEAAYSFKFTVLPPLNAPAIFETQDLILYGLLLAAIISLVFYLLMQRNKKSNQQKLQVAKQQKEMAKSQFQTIRAQLNPHFMYNALAGIQNLMNQNNVEASNKYLSIFARITRQALSDQEMITLHDEAKFLEDYLQMEQLRTPFNYTFTFEDSLDIQNIEIPTMLLQPLVENAVKHGVSTMKEGLISIHFFTNKNNLILSVNDNGTGYDASKVSSGLGINLTKKRIELLNTLYPESTLKLICTSSKEGTETEIHLQHWL